MSQTSYSFCLWETNGLASERASEGDLATLFHSIFGGKTSVSSVRSEADRTPDRVKKHLNSSMCMCKGFLKSFHFSWVLGPFVHERLQSLKTSKDHFGHDLAPLTSTTRSLQWCHTISSKSHLQHAPTTGRACSCQLLSSFTDLLTQSSWPIHILGNIIKYIYRHQENWGLLGKCCLGSLGNRYWKLHPKINGNGQHSDPVVSVFCLWSCNWCYVLCYQWVLLN